MDKFIQMKKRFILFLFLLLLFNCSFGQVTFKKSYNEFQDFTSACKVKQTADGGFILAGLSPLSTGVFGSMVVKTDSLGDTLWTRNYGPNQSSNNCSIQQTTDGGYVFCGATNSYGAGLFDVLLIRTDSVGDTLWTKTYGGPLDDYGYSAVQTLDGGFIITGSTKSFGAGGTDAFLIETNAVGDINWMKTYGDSLDDVAESVVQTNDSGYIITGSALIKTDATGDTLWTKRIHACGGHAVRQTSDNGYVVCGWEHVNFGNDFYLLKFDSIGNIGWQQHYGGVYVDGGSLYLSDDAYSVEQTADGGYILGGGSGLGGGVGYSHLVIKTTANGDPEWINFNDVFDGGMEKVSVVQANDGGYVFARSDHALYKVSVIGNMWNCQESSTSVSYFEHGSSSNAVFYAPCTVSSANFETSNAPLNITRGCIVVNYCEGEIVGIQNTDENLQITIFPNPANHTFTINLPEEFTGPYAKLKIVDVTGRGVYNQNIISKSTIVNHRLSPGIYVVKVETGENEFTSKLLVE